MLDIGWSELLLIAVVAIVVIGPKDLPDALRTLGRMTSKLRRMASEFQGQFNQAIREANLEDVKKDFDELRQSASALRGGLNPLDVARNEIKGAIAASAPAALAEPLSTPATPSAPTQPPAAAAPAEGSSDEASIPS